MVFTQDRSDRGAVIMEVFNPGGLWENTPEQGEYRGAAPRVGQQITFTHARFTSKFAITEEMIEDDQHSVVRQAITARAGKAQVTQNRESAGLFRNASGTTLTADGVAALSASHTNDAGDTIDNTISGAISVATVEEGINLLAEQVDQAGDIVGHEAKTVLVPPATFKEATQILESKLESNTTDHQMNHYSAKYGITIRQSNYIGTNAGGRDNHWFMMGENHSIMRWVRVPVQTKLLSGDFQDNGDTIYRGRYREQYGIVTYEAFSGFEGS